MLKQGVNLETFILAAEQTLELSTHCSSVERDSLGQIGKTSTRLLPTVLSMNPFWLLTEQQGLLQSRLWKVETPLLTNPEQAL